MERIQFFLWFFLAKQSYFQPHGSCLKFNLNMAFSIKVKMLVFFISWMASSVQLQKAEKTAVNFVYLALYHSLWNIVHGTGKPTFKAFCKIANGLGQGTCTLENKNRMKRKQCTCLEMICILRTLVLNFQVCCIYLVDKSSLGSKCFIEINYTIILVLL